MADIETSETIDGIVTKRSPRPVNETVARFVELANARGLKVFDVIDQSAEAGKAGLDLRPTTLVLFGNPAAGTRVMDAAPLSALDLPLKILVWEDGPDTKVTYLSPTALGTRYELSPELSGSLAGIEPLTDALVAP